MRGSIKQRYKGSWSLILDLGYEPRIDPATGEPKINETTGKPEMRRKQKWFTFRGTKKQAQTRLTDLLKEVNDGVFVEPTEMTVGAWLPLWLEIAKPRLRKNTYIRYAGIIENDLQKSSLAGYLLHQLRSSHIEQYYAAATVSASTLTLHHAVLHQALRKAVRDGLMRTNVAVNLEGKPKREKKASPSDEARQHAWSAPEARDFLAAARAAGPQPAAFYATALDTGMRKGELGGLKWANLDLDAGKVVVREQLLEGGKEPVYGPTKTGKPRVITLSAETVELLRAHRKAQAELKLKNRTAYHDHGLVFAKEWGDVRRREECLGQPLQLNNIGQREYAKLIAASGVRTIKFHGLRHTCATLLLQAGTPIHVVSERLGHAKVSMTMEVYAHVLPDMQKDAAATMGALLHGR